MQHSVTCDFSLESVKSCLKNLNDVISIQFGLGVFIEILRASLKSLAELLRPISERHCTGRQSRTGGRQSNFRSKSWLTTG